MELDPFLKCVVLDLPDFKYPYRPFQVSLLNTWMPHPDRSREKYATLCVDFRHLLGKNLLNVQIVTMRPQYALVRLPYCPEGYEKREFWVPREQIEWH